MKTQGFVALVIVLIISAIALLIGLSISLLSVGEIKMSLQKSQSSQSYYLANLCAEEALMKLKDDIDYPGEILNNIENGSCIISVEGNWIVKVSANFSNQTKKIKIIISQISPQMIIISWQEAANF